LEGTRARVAELESHRQSGAHAKEREREIKRLGARVTKLENAIYTFLEADHSYANLRAALGQ
jgi:hypothetical protein